MFFPSLSFVFGLVLVGYLLTFVSFAVLRILTGVSIQRLSFFGLRRISFSPRHGVRLAIRGLGLKLHRPTFPLPTWCSLVVDELSVTLDLNALGESKVPEKASGSAHVPQQGIKRSLSDFQDEEGHGKLWRKLTDIKERIKRVHSNIKWIKLVDLVATEVSLNIVGVGSVELERVTLSVDTRAKTVDRSRLFQHHKTKPEAQSPAEWKCMIRSILFTPEGKDSSEILDHCTLNVHGMLHNRLQGLRDASIALKLGRLNLPYDEFEQARRTAQMIRGKYASPHSDQMDTEFSLSDALDELEYPGSHDDHFVRTVSDSRAFIASILRGIQEVQFAIGFVGLSRKLEVKGQNDNDVYFNLAMKEVGVDILRLDPKSPAHRMYFSTDDVAHQGLVTAIAISAGIDDGREHPERLIYVPMVTATVKTTLPSRTVHFTSDSNVKERNTNMLYANFVCTSPSMDLDPKHLPLLQDILKHRTRSHRPTPSTRSDRHRILSQLLPKAHVKLAIQEPVIRVSLPPIDKANAREDDFDLLITAVSSISFELESSHAAEAGIEYSLSVHYRHTRHHLYYQTTGGEQHDLLQSDTVEVQIDVNAIPEPSVTVSAQFRTYSLYLVRADICEGVHQIVKQLRRNVLSRQNTEPHPSVSFLRTLPAWFAYCRVEGTDFSFELAGVDDQVSDDSRGFSLQLGSWTTEYTAHRDERTTHVGRRTSIARSSSSQAKAARRQSPPPRKHQSLADGRRLTVHLQNFEGLIVDSVPDCEPESFILMPQYEVAFSTSTDNHGPLMHVNLFTKSLLLQYSLYNHFALGVAYMVIQRTFLDRVEDQAKPPPPLRQASLHVPGIPLSPTDELDEIARREIITIDVKADLVQLKARMPADPPMMVQVYGLEAGRHRWALPFLRSRLARMYVRVPRTKAAWSRIITLRSVRFDLRDIKRKVGKQIHTEKSMDIVAETIRLAVPHSLILHSVTDNIMSVVKVSKQLGHHFVTGTDEYVLIKEPEGPKRVPRITVRAQLFLFDIEDSSFEWKLGAIYRAGLLEQKQRLAREEAFRLKEKRLSRSFVRGSSRFRAHSAQADERSRSRVRLGNIGKRRSHSTQPTGSLRSYSNKHASKPVRSKMRYEADGKCGISDNSDLSVEQARDKLNQLNSQSWKLRIDRVLSFQSHVVREIRTMVWGADQLEEEDENQEPILQMSERPGLMLIAITDLGLTIDKPSFPIDEFPKFLHDVGKGMPFDMKYGLTVPMSLHVTMGELRFQLRDYPLPLLHVPMLGSGQSTRLPALSMRTDFVIAEEFRDVESQRHVNVEVVPAGKMSSGSKGFSIDVRRTITPIKTYSDMKFEINTSNPTKITWGTSYQPAIQEAMQVIEGFTKPPIDPSDRIGFWDKIRLSFHSRVNVVWKGDGDVHLIMKGTRDPYVVTGDGAGLVMVWRNDVRWNIAQSKDPRQFMTVDSSDYILAVPDFNAYARRAQDDSGSADGASSTSNGKRDAVFRKVIMKLSGNVRWLAGLVFEREVPGDKRMFDFKPHYDVVLKNPEFAKAPPGEEYDAYRDFRSHHIHMSIAVIAPQDRDWSVSNLKPSSNYNTVHLTPRFFSHFFSWWRMFSGTMSLPVRQGPLWGVTAKKSKKFGRHIATIKYSLLLSPLYIAHVYKHKDAEEYKGNTVSVTGLKMKLDSFMLDLHQRREHFDIKDKEGLVTKKTSAMRIHQAQLDFIHADLRALSASIAGTTVADIEKASDEVLASLHGQTPEVDMSKFEIPDNDFEWIDMDDYVELDWILPVETDPETKILPLGYAPRFTYFRQTDHGGIIAGDPSRTSPFGDEPTHYCVMSVMNDPRRVQAELIEQRLETLRQQKERNESKLGDQELVLVRTVSGDKVEHQKLQEKLNILRSHGEHLQRKHDFLQAMLHALVQRLENDDPVAVPALETSEEFFEAHEHAKPLSNDVSRMDAVPLSDYTSDFNNRFIVHNAQIKWNNSLRNIILRYIHQVSQRRGFVYYMSRRAVKFILDVLEERKKAEEMEAPQRRKSHATVMTMLSPDADDEQTVQERIEQLLRDGRDFVDADDPVTEGQASPPTQNEPTEDIAQEFTPLNIYHFRLIAPQIQLQSEKNPKSAVLVTAKGMQLKIIEIMDKANVNDDVSGLVQRRFTAAADSLQMFVTSTKTFSTEFFHMYSANLYGARAGTQWPPWVPMEIMFDFQSNPYGFDRVVHRTSASLRYDKYNNLRLKYNDDVSGGEPKSNESAKENEERMDHVWLEFPHFRAICDSAQYYSMYIIVMDVLLYNEPLEKTRSERLEKIMLASDFSDLTGAPEMVQMLQERIRQLEEIKMHFQINEKYLDRQGWKDRITMDQDLAACEDELFFMMKAITTSQQRVEDRREQENATGLVHLSMRAKEIAWHLVREKEESLVEFQLKNASFDRTDNNDGSNYNTVEIGRINGYNLLPNALYPEIIAPFTDEAKGGRELGHEKMLRIQWLMLEAIAGIPVVDYFEIDLAPLKMQVEREVAKKIFEYVFPGQGGNAFEGGSLPSIMSKNNLPTQQEENDDDVVVVKADSPSSSTPRIAPMPQTPLPSLSQSHDEGPGSLQQRLHPTLHLPKQRKMKAESKGLGISGGPNLHGFTLFQHKNTSQQTLSRRSAQTRQVLASLNSPALSRSPSDRSIVTMGSTQTGDADRTNNSDKRSRLHRTRSDEKKSKKKTKDEPPSDDLTQMMNRASNYMTLAFVKLPSMVLCLSYKGQGKRNLEDVHDLVFRMPTLEYRNKTWSNLDLALQLKKDIIRALISHAGAIVSNKFSHHKPKRDQQGRLRELVNMSTFVATGGGQGSSTASSETSSMFDVSGAGGEANGRPSTTASARPSTLSQTISLSTSSSPSRTGDSASDMTKSFTAANGSGAPSPARPRSHAGFAETSSSLLAPAESSEASLSSPQRSRATSIGRTLSGIGERFFQRSSNNNNNNNNAANHSHLQPQQSLSQQQAQQTHDAGSTTLSGEETEQDKRKSKLLLGGQRLFLRGLRD